MGDVNRLYIGKDRGNDLFGWSKQRRAYCLSGRDREQKVISEGSKAMKDGLKKVGKRVGLQVEGVLKGIRIDLVEVGLKR